MHYLVSFNIVISEIKLKKKKKFLIVIINNPSMHMYEFWPSISDTTECHVHHAKAEIMSRGYKTFLCSTQLSMEF